MNRQNTEKIITEYLKPIYGFALKHCKNPHDAEDISQDITMKIFRNFLKRDDIENPDKYIWAIAHNTLANYYRKNCNSHIGVSIDEVADMLTDESVDIETELIVKESISKLHSEIAYLSKTQRRILIAYYYENKKQEAIASELGIPVGTVKWHLFESKKDLKKGMETMRRPSELKFNPIKFDICSTNGSIGSKGNNNNFFRNALSQNIVYSVWNDAKTINQIAEDLGVSPVYVEGEVEYLEKYGFLTKDNDKYLCNILLNEPTAELNALQDEMYDTAARYFANELYYELISSDFWNDSDITGGYNKDKNFCLWALIPYIGAMSGEEQLDVSVSFEEAATVRPDGGHNICYAQVFSNDTYPKYFDSMRKLCGPCWNSKDGNILWQIDSQWSERRVDDNYSYHAQRILTLYTRLRTGEILSKDEYAYLAERGIIRMLDNDKYEFLCICINSDNAKQKLIALGDRIKAKYRNEFNALRDTYCKAVLSNTPKHLLKMQKYGLQFIFYSDGWFMLHCLNELIDSGKLKLPTEEQMKALTTLIISK